jgi:LAGLIDADG endonuclease
VTPEYLAGLFDGEGCIDVQRMYPKAGRNRLYVRPRVRMCMSDNVRFLMQMLRDKFGGHLCSRKAGERNQQNSWSLEWLNGNDMRRLLNLILPHLILKAEQAKLVLWWLDNASGRQTTAGYAGMEQARAAFAEELRAMKVDPQRLSERAVERIASLMRQSGLHGDMERAAEMAVPLG